MFLFVFNVLKEGLNNDLTFIKADSLHLSSWVGLAAPGKGLYYSHGQIVGFSNKSLLGGDTRVRTFFCFLEHTEHEGACRLFSRDVQLSLLFMNDCT